MRTRGLVGCSLWWDKIDPEEKSKEKDGMDIFSGRETFCPFLVFFSNFSPFVHSNIPSLLSLFLFFGCILH